MMDERRNQEKKTYEQPRVTVISLRPEEAVLGTCKSLSVSGPGNAGTCAMVGNCTTMGS